MALNEVIPKDEVKEHQTKVESLYERMSAIKVSSKDELTTVAGHIAQVKETGKFVKSVRDKYIAPAKQIIDQAKIDFDPIIARCLEIETVLKKKAEEFMLAEKKKEDDEKARILRDARTKVETKVEKLDDVAKAETKVKTEDGKTLNMSMVKEVVVVDEKLIPEEYYKPRELDMVKIKKVATAGVIIPGVEVREKPQMGMR